jgi:DNA-binding beta-propeller fold protein YncE
MRLAARGACALFVVSAIGLTVVPTPVGAATTLPMAYVTNSQLHSVSIYEGGQFVGTIRHVGPGPTGIAIDSTGSTAYVADYGFLDQPASTVTPLDLATGTAEAPITVGAGPLAIAVTPGNRFALVTLQGTSAKPGHRVREINLVTRAVSAPVTVGLNPESLAVTPDGTTAYVADFGSAEVTPVDLTTWPPKALPPIPLPGTSPRAIAISPDGQTAYVLDAENATIIPISIPSGTVGQPVDLVCRMQGDPGCTPSAIVISPDGSAAYVSAAGSADVIMLNLPSLTVAGVVETGAYPDALGLSGRWLYVANGASNTMSVFSGLKPPQTVGGVTYPFGVAVVPSVGGETHGVNPIDATAPAPRARVYRTAVRVRPAPFYGLPPAVTPAPKKSAPAL